MLNEVILYRGKESDISETVMQDIENSASRVVSFKDVLPRDTICPLCKVEGKTAEW